MGYLKPPAARDAVRARLRLTRESVGGQRTHQELEQKFAAQKDAKFVGAAHHPRP